MRFGCQIVYFVIYMRLHFSSVFVEFFYDLHNLLGLLHKQKLYADSFDFLKLFDLFGVPFFSPETTVG